MTEPKRHISVKETAKALGTSLRTTYRMIHEEGLPATRMGRRSYSVPVEALNEWLDNRRLHAHTTDMRTESVVAGKEVKQCHTGAKILKFGGQATQTKAAKELGARLGLKAKKRQKL